MSQPNTQLELTIRASIIGIFLAIILCGANVYLGLKIGNTISASIPAAVLSMGILHMLKNYSILENSIAQTIASAGEAIAAAVIFIFPALLILNVWHEFDYWSICILALCGGVVGIIFSVILRRVLLEDKTLAFPEGQAIAKVLSASNHSNKANFKTLLLGMCIAGLLNFCQTGLQILASSYHKIFNAGNHLFGSAISFSPAIIGAGYLVGFGPVTVSFIACIISWLIFLPIFSGVYGLPDVHNITGSAFTLWKTYIRPIGIGTLIFSGIATIIGLIKPISKGIQESISALKNIHTIAHSERDLNIKKLAILLVVACIPICLFIFSQLHELTNFSLITNFLLTCGLIIVILIIGFIIASVAGYFAGLVGSTNSPYSGLFFIAVISITLILKFITDIAHSHNLNQLFTTIILIVSFIGFAAAITNDNVQDYKSGQLVGASPYKQQISLFFGVIAAAFLSPLFIKLIFNAYGIAGIVPHPGIDPNTTLSAPQASAIALLTQNIIQRSQDWSLLFYGFIIGAIALFIDIIGRQKQKFRCPILSVGLGIYLPPDLVAALFVGGLLHFLINRRHKQLGNTFGHEKISSLNNKINLFVCGLVAGESLMGLFLAVPFILKQSSDAFKIVGDNFVGISQLLSAIITLLLLFYIYKMAQKNN